MIGVKNYQEKLFVNFQLSSKIPQDNLYRKILENVNFSFIRQMVSTYYGKEGKKSIDPVVFFKLMLVGYLENLNSDRKIIETSRLRLDVLYFIGYDVDEELPWHSTLSRTRQLYGEGVFKAVFKAILMLCVENGMVSGKRQAVDSVLLRANASMESLEEKAILKIIDEYADELDNNQETPAPTKMEIVPDNEDEKQVKKERPKRSNKTHFSKTDPEARMATKRGKPYQLTYLGQVCVDTDSHIITNAEAFPSDMRDSQCLKDLLIQTQENLYQTGLKVEEILADTNYSSSDSLQSLEGLSVTGYIPNHGGYKQEREGFKYDKENDRFVCSQEKPLNYKGEKVHNTVSKVYISSQKDCAQCPLKVKCIGKGRSKTITVNIKNALFEKMNLRTKSSKGKKMKLIRQSTVEPVIGSLVTNLGLRKLNARGLAAANKILYMSAAAYNLKKLMKNLPTSMKNTKQKAIAPLNQIKQFRKSAIIQLNLILKMMTKSFFDEKYLIVEG